MTYEPRIGPDGRDDDLTRALRQIYAAPAEEGYWSTLAQRIMSHIAGAVDAESWWSPLADWARVGIVAAAAAVIVAGLALTKSREAEARLAYDTIIETPRTAPLQIATEHGSGSVRDATLRYVISP